MHAATCIPSLHPRAPGHGRCEAATDNLHVVVNRIGVSDVFPSA